ncbi:MAG: 1,4-beta-xylanase [Myxococcota bacterium]|nr:1,4-beta-xylanase [Myxococcota bacterium]
MTKHLPQLTMLMMTVLMSPIGCGSSSDDVSSDTAMTPTSSGANGAETAGRDQWSQEVAMAWYAQHSPLIGFNYVPRTAVNQLEMWQADTWDPETIDEELSWAADIGLNTARVFLHDLMWTTDKEGFLSRIDAFLDIAAKHKIGVMFVFFDGVWHPAPKVGPQPEPTPGVHNSQWLQSPGAAILDDPDRYAELEPYIKGVISAYRTDERVVVWDLFNEPNNPNELSYAETDLSAEIKASRALALLKKARTWALSVNPTQPLTAGVWDGDWSDESALSPINAYMLTAFDIVSFHTSAEKATVEGQIEALKKFGRPMLCTEYMARPLGSTFEDILQLFTAANIGAYQWGFVNGRSQTIYSWLSWITPSDSEPDPWFHDLLRSDGTPYDAAEIVIIKRALQAK